MPQVKPHRSIDSWCGAAGRGRLVGHTLWRSLRCLPRAPSFVCLILVSPEVSNVGHAALRTKEASAIGISIIESQTELFHSSTSHGGPPNRKLNR
jgi:hypothetical protein